jgi:hypothetical protein
MFGNSGGRLPLGAATPTAENIAKAGIRHFNKYFQKHHTFTDFFLLWDLS